MLAVEVEFLMGRSLATQADERTEAEWPPHPQRLFSALVATLSELELGAPARAALEWLEKLPPPELRADTNPPKRQVLSHWVPVNDDAIKPEKSKSDFRHPLERRNRQERFFPAVVPEDPTVVYQWPNADGVAAHREALVTLVESVTYLGHSASPIRACLLDAPVEPTLRPSDDGAFVLRVPGPGRLARLEQIHGLRLRDESVQAPVGRLETYESKQHIARSVFLPHAYVVAFGAGPRLSLDSSLPLMQHLRDAILSRLGDKIPRKLSGHLPDGRADTEPHLAIAPLGFVNAKHADGSLKGAAFILPREADLATRRRLRVAVEGNWNLQLGPLGSLVLKFVEQTEQPMRSLRFTEYTGQAHTWASVTPVVLDRHPKRNGPTVERIIAESCVRIGLPEPVEVRIGHVSAISGAPPVPQFHGRSKQTDGRLRKHVLLRFEERVQGPILIGAGRFMGLGLFLPMRVQD
ncbi:MAG: type I-U CRISPR-associated protein Csb2 [Pseudomonadota bacterium]|nr:type I-U CRISPR-associated protein Csb2 [Pseudomonadota bacterium]